MQRVSAGYSNLEFDLESGTRDRAQRISMRYYAA